VRVEEAARRLGYWSDSFELDLLNTHRDTLSVRVDGASGAHHDAGQCPYGADHPLTREAVQECAEAYVASEIGECGVIGQPVKNQYYRRSDLPTLRVVADERCPECGGEGSPKVCGEDGVWSWKCFAAYGVCSVGYWVPGVGKVEDKVDPTSPEQVARMLEIAEQVRRQVEEHGIKVTTYHADGQVTDDSLPPLHLVKPRHLTPEQAAAEGFETLLTGTIVP
jgi:hypothetical protein